MNSWLKVLFFSGILILASCSSPSRATQELSQDSTSAQTPGPEPEGENSIRGEIFITVDESLQPIIDTEIFSFMAVHPEATVHPIYLPGEEAVARMMQSDSFRLAITTRTLTKAENAALRAELITADYGIVGYDAVAIFVNQDNPLTVLSEAQAVEILNGKLRNWSQLEIDQGKDIQLVFDHAQSGALRFLRDSVLKGQALSAGNVFAQESTPEMMAYVSENPQAIGFGGISWISDRDDPIVDSLMEGLKLIKIAPTDKPETCFEEANAFAPYQSYIFQECYPWVRTIRTIRRESIYGVGAGFTAYLVGPKGQRILHKSGLVVETNVPRRVSFPPKENSRDLR